MIYIHRFLGTWLDNNKGPNKKDIISKAVAPGSTIYEYLKQYGIRKKFIQALRTGNYYYGVPKEISIEDTRADRYYRMEIEEDSLLANYSAYYGSGTAVYSKYLFSNIKVRSIYEYESLDLLLDELKEEVELTISCAYNPCHVLSSELGEFKASIELGKLFLSMKHAPNERKPIAEIEI
jgi:hypothetical protein